jgi:pimeloyl-ACP methyl ester carboxylesterase
MSTRLIAATFGLSLRVLCLAVVFLATSAAAPAGLGAGSKGGYAQIGQLRMYYEIRGQGAPLLILHGGGSTIQTTYGAILPELVKTRTVIAPEQQGHGHTADLDRPLSYRQMAEDTAALLKKLNVGPVDVLGFSNGGTVAMELAIHHPEAVRRLVIASVYAKPEDIRPELLASFRTATAQSMPDVYRTAYLAVAPNPADLPKLTPKLMAAILSFDGFSDADLAAIKAPTLILQADNDIAPVERIAAMQRKISGAELAVLPGGHGGYLGEVMAARPGSRLPIYTTGLVLEFLDAP